MKNFMLFSESPKMQWLSKQSLLIAFFFVFSFNHITLTKYHFVLGQASFYFISIALIIGYFPIFKTIPKRSLLFFAVFLIYCLGFSSLFCWTGQGVCSSRSYTAAISILFVFLSVQYVAYLVQKDPRFAYLAEQYLVFGAWALVMLSVPDILKIIKGGVINHPPYGLELLSSFGLSPYAANRLRAFTQEPSYLGMVIATLYPICFIRLNEKISISRITLVIGLWTCLIFSVSRTGLLTCFIITFIIFLGWPKRLFVFVSLLLVLSYLNFFTPYLPNNDFLGLSSISLINATNIDASTLIRSAHILASLKAWLANPFFGLGLGQSGFLLPQFYPDWYTELSPEYGVWASKSLSGGTPSLSFLPKLLAEIGLLGLGILLFWGYPLADGIIKSFKNHELIRKYSLAFFGFLLASFGVEGYLFLPAWLILGLFIGLSRRISGSCNSN